MSTSTISAAPTSVAVEPTAPELARAAGIGPIEYLRGRGYVQDVTDEAGLAAAFAAGPVSAYVGFDPTASSLHIGHLMGIMALATLQRFGHRPIALGGGGTALVGDPTGKTATRAVLSEELIRENLVNILKQFDRHLDFAGGRFGDHPAALLVNNADWLVKLRYIEFLRDIGRHFSVNEMLAAETYKVRLESTGLNFVEFNYRIVQAYDFLHLYREEGTTLQMGGSDQWGNIVAGADLIRRADGGKAFCLVWPLLTTASGQKMGKTEGNSVWLDPEQTPPPQFFDYWMNVEDADVPKLLRLYTFLPDDAIKDLTSGTGASLREAKLVLAHQTTLLTHGREHADHALRISAAQFGTGHIIEASAHFSATSKMNVSADVVSQADIPTTEIPASEVADLTVADVFVRTGLCESRGDARRQAAQGGLSIDGESVADVDAPFTPASGPSVFRRGKKRFRRVVVG